MEDACLPRRYGSQSGGIVTHMSTTNFNKLNTKIGFIGLGLMGSRLTYRLHSSGWKIQAWNRSPRPADAANQEGKGIEPLLSDLVTHSEVILSSLANDAAVRSVYFDKGGVFSAAKPGSVI